jgi:hypothetical protein
LSLSTCLAPTEIVVQLTTDVDCATVVQNGIGIAVGPPGNDKTSNATTSHKCDTGGELGSIVVVPSGNGPTVGIRITLGFDASVENCDEANGFGGCIVARRALEFDLHRPLTLPIKLEADCAGQTCDPTSTCFQGVCVDASVPCADASCELPDAGKPPGPCTASTTPVLVVTGIQPFTPHITTLPGTNDYIVSYLEQNVFTVQEITQAGALVGGPTGLLSSTGITALGPLGTDGQEIISVLIDSTHPSIALGKINSNQAPMTTTTVVTALPLYGMVSNGAGTFLSLVDYASGGNAVDDFDTVNRAVSIVPSGTISFTGVSAAGLAHAGSTYFATFTDAAGCTLLTGTGNNTAITWTKGYNDTTCSAIRVAPSADGSTWATTTHATNSGGDSLRMNSGVPNLTGPIADDPAAIMPVFTSAGPVAVLSAGDVIRMEGFNTGPAIQVSAQATGYYTATGKGASFDAVADDPAASAGFGVVWFEGGRLLFAHECVQ